MTPISKKNDDTKILVAVAGVVVAGAAGLALLAGLGSGPRVEGQRAARSVAAERTAPVERGSIDTAMRGGRRETAAETASFEKSGGSTVTVELGVLAEPPPVAFRFVPGENLVAGGLAAWNGRDYERAAAYFEAQTQARGTDAWSHYMFGLSCWKAGRADEAVPALERAAELDPSFIRTPINLSRIQNDRGDFEAALAAARTALDIDPDDAQARFLEGRSLNNLGRTDEALSALEQSLAADAGDGYVHNLLGLVLLEAGDSARAAEALERAAELEPSVAFIQNNLGMAAEHRGDRETAVAAYRRAVELNAGYDKAVRNLARLEPTTPEATVADAALPVAGDVVETASAGSLN